MRFQSFPGRPLNSLQSPIDIDAAVRHDFQRDCFVKVRFRLVGSSKPLQSQASEVVDARVFAFLLDDFIQKFLRLRKVAPEVSRPGLRIHRVKRLCASGGIRVQADRLLRCAAVLLERSPCRSLNAFQSAGHVDARGSGGFQAGSLFEVRPGFVSPPQSEPRQATEVVNPWIGRVRLNQLGQLRFGLIVILDVVGGRGLAIQRDAGLSRRRVRRGKK